VAAESAMGVTDVFGAASFVIVAGFDGNGRKDVVQVVAIGLLVYPFSDRGEHVALDFDVLIADGGVVEDAEDIIHYFFYWNPRVLPRVEDSWCNVL
jgi:hypothetical protein